MSTTLKNTFAVLGPDGGITPIEATDELDERLARDFGGFAGRSLVSCRSFDVDWPAWERHPAGDKIVCLLSGEARLVIDHGNRHEEIALDEPLAFAIVPRGTWHTARTHTGCTLLFVSRGEGTENRNV